MRASPTRPRAAGPIEVSWGSRLTNGNPEGTFEFAFIIFARRAGHVTDFASNHPIRPAKQVERIFAHPCMIIESKIIACWAYWP